MEYKAKVCPICGSSSIKEISNDVEEENVFYSYKCNSCCESFSTKKSFIEKNNNLRMKEKKQNLYGDDLSPRDIFRMNINNIIEINSSKGNVVCSGTGILIGNGYVLTNKHVISPEGSSESNFIDLCDDYIGESEHILPHELEFVYFDKVKDIALMHSDKLNSKINFSDGHVDTGERVYAIGNSKGYGLCIVDGLVSDNSRTVNGNEYIMISAPTTNGNSGGPLLNSRGELIGMVTAGDANVKTMNYAIPLKDILEFLDKVSKSEGINFNF